MLVVHALWDDPAGAIALWAEDGEAAGRSQAPPRSAVRRPPRHPFAAEAGALCSWLTRRGQSGAALGCSEGSVVIEMPGTRARPEPSPSLVVRADVPRAASRARRGLYRFEVPALHCDPHVAIDLLLALGNAPSVRCGDSVACWATVAELALGAVAAGRVIPVLELEPGGGGSARWRALEGGEDLERLGKVAAAMPAVGLGGPGVAHDALARAFAAFIDAACRDALRARTGRPTPSPTGGAAAAWVEALGRDDPRVDAPAGEVALLAQRLAEWRAPLMAPPTSWRVCFRLVEPDERTQDPPEGPWRVELLLQAVDDPSLLVGAAEVWRSGESLRRAARTVESPHEVLLGELGRAVRVFPALSAALEEPAPTTLHLDAVGAHRFLVESAPALEVAGFGVLVPAWWRRQGSRLGVRLRATSQPARARAGGGRLTLHALATVDWEVAVGDEVLTRAELQRLAQLKAPLVQVRGQWTQIRPEEVERLLELVSEPRRTMRPLDLVRAAAGVASASDGVEVHGVDAAGELGAFLAGDLAESLEVHGTPPGFCGTLRPYQARGVAWICFLERVGLGACLADDMGLGKTATVLAVVQAEHAEGAGGPTLVVCPTSVVGNWRREVERFTPGLRALVHHGAGRARGEDFAREARDADVVITSYPLVERDRTAMAAVLWHRVVLDEAQQVKNPSAKQTQAVRQLHAERRLALTGTPVENHLGELWSIMEILNPGLLGSASSFRERFAVPIERYGDDEAAARLRALTRPFLLRRLKTDRSVIDDLPDKLEMTVRCSLTREQATLYQAVVDDMLARIADAEGIERKGLVLATMLRLKQVCNHPAQFLADGSALAGRSGKLERTVEVLEEVRAAGEKALVFTQFAEMGAMLQDHLSERLACRVGFLHGGVPRARRDELVAELEDPSGSMPVLVLSLKAGGTGLNLTAASHVVHFDRWWNPAVEDQATDRAFRIGQRRDVQVRKLVCAGTVEDRIDEVIEAKRHLSARVLRAGEGWLTELSTEDLAEVIALSAEELDP